MWDFAAVSKHRVQQESIYFLRSADSLISLTAVVKLTTQAAGNPYDKWQHVLPVTGTEVGSFRPTCNKTPVQLPL